MSETMARVIPLFNDMGGDPILMPATPEGVEEFGEGAVCEIPDEDLEEYAIEDTEEV